ncbi:MAG: isoprenylcysteine carboxylmethyltransferase family protein [Candidatus Omnitrophica bacterium]|nr:isoprenylcysteine carboxylmethyltransferase family protein [Candidatus Omnitrophota bacterium]
MKQDCFRINRARQWPAYALGAVYAIIVAYQGIVLHPLGVTFVVAGMAIRFWAAGYIRKRRELAVSGPYAFVRNPLYLGSFLIGAGFVLFLSQVVLLIVYAAAYWWLYRKTIREEEKILTELFQEQYLEYRKHVPVFFPRRAPYSRGAASAVFSWPQACRNREVVRIFTIVGLLVALYWVQCAGGNTMSVWTRYGIPGILAVIAGLALFLNHVVKRHPASTESR